MTANKRIGTLVVDIIQEEIIPAGLLLECDGCHRERHSTTEIDGRWLCVSCLAGDGATNYYGVNHDEPHSNVTAWIKMGDCQTLRTMCFHTSISAVLRNYIVAGLENGQLEAIAKVTK